MSEVTLPKVARNEEITIEEFNCYKTNEEITGYYLTKKQADIILGALETCGDSSLPGYFDADAVFAAQEIMSGEKK